MGNTQAVEELKTIVNDESRDAIQRQLALNRLDSVRWTLAGALGVEDYYQRYVRTIGDAMDYSVSTDALIALLNIPESERRLKGLSEEELNKIRASWSLEDNPAPSFRDDDK